jgi:sugar/nucleoside kinase (ribokinase family)
MTRRGFLTAGTWCADHNKMIERWPAEDMVVEILDQSVAGGGSACNFAVDIRRLDPAMPVGTIGVIGDDAFGKVLERTIDENGIERYGVVITDAAATNFTDAYSVRATGRRTHLFHAGTSELLSPEHFDFGRTTARILHLGLPGIHKLMDAPWGDAPSGWAAVLKAAQAAGIETNLEMLQIDPARLRAIVEPCLGLLDYLVVNDYEVGALTERRTVEDGATDVDACVAAATEVMARGTMRVLAIHFPRGAIAFERDGTVTRRASVDAPPAEVRGANGAGDAFAAGMMYALHEGWDVGRALTLAHASAAASLRAISTTDSVVPWRDCLALADRWGWRTPI